MDRVIPAPAIPCQRFRVHIAGIKRSVSIYAVAFIRTETFETHVIEVVFWLVHGHGAPMGRDEVV